MFAPCRKVPKNQLIKGESVVIIMGNNSETILIVDDEKEIAMELLFETEKVGKEKTDYMIDKKEPSVRAALSL